MKIGRELLFAVFFALIATGIVPMGAPATAQAVTVCDIEDTTPGGCGNNGCHCNFEGICEDSDSCLDAWDAAIDECGGRGLCLEGFECIDPYEPPVVFEFHCSVCFCPGI